MAYIKRLSELPIQNVPTIGPLAWTASPSEVRARMHASCASACRECLHESVFLIGPLKSRPKENLFKLQNVHRKLAQLQNVNGKFVQQALETRPVCKTMLRADISGLLSLMSGYYCLSADIVNNKKCRCRICGNFWFRHKLYAPTFCYPIAPPYLKNRNLILG